MKTNASALRSRARRSAPVVLRGIFLPLPAVLIFTLLASTWAPASEMRRIGVLTPGGTLGPVLDGLRESLTQLGYAEGKQISLSVEDTQMDTVDPLKAALRMVESKPHLMVTVSISNTAAAKQVAGHIPIVFTVVADPVRAGLVDSYTSSKNNLTGVSTNTAGLSGKRLDLLKQMLPGLKRVLVIVAAKERSAEIAYEGLAETAKKIPVQLIRREVTSKAEIEQVLRETPKGSVDAIIHAPSNLVRSHISALIDKAIKDKLPLSVHEESIVRMGALVSYGSDFRLTGMQTAKIVARVLSGTRPSDIPIETPERPVLALNRTTAGTIGLKVPRKFLELVDRLVD